MPRAANQSRAARSSQRVEASSSGPVKGSLKPYARTQYWSGPIGTLRVAEGKISGFNGVVYVQVPDIELSCKKATELGATVVPGFPFDLSNDKGSIGLFTDPVGHPLGMYSRTALAKAKPVK